MQYQKTTLDPKISQVVKRLGTLTTVVTSMVRADGAFSKADDCRHLAISGIRSLNSR